MLRAIQDHVRNSQRGYEQRGLHSEGQCSRLSSKGQVSHSHAVHAPASRDRHEGLHQRANMSQSCE